MAGPRQLASIAAKVRACTLCPLHATRTLAVPGEGDPRAGVVLVGEAPGRREDESGRPFQGAAGRNLDAALAVAGLAREALFVTSVAKCRPPGNRDPTPLEKEACRPYLVGQLAAIRPRVVVALGRHALASLVADPPALGQAHGTFCGRYDGVPVWASLHPAAVIYRQKWRADYLEDWRRFGRWIAAGLEAHQWPPP